MVVRGTTIPRWGHCWVRAEVPARPACGGPSLSMGLLWKQFKMSHHCLDKVSQVSRTFPVGSFSSNVTQLLSVALKGTEHNGVCGDKCRDKDDRGDHTLSVPFCQWICRHCSYCGSFMHSVTHPPIYPPSHPSIRPSVHSSI